MNIGDVVRVVGYAPANGVRGRVEREVDGLLTLRLMDTQKAYREGETFCVDGSKVVVVESKGVVQPEKIRLPRSQKINKKQLDFFD